MNTSKKSLFALVILLFLFSGVLSSCRYAIPRLAMPMTASELPSNFSISGSTDLEIANFSDASVIYTFKSSRNEELMFSVLASYGLEKFIPDKLSDIVEIRDNNRAAFFFSNGTFFIQNLNTDYNSNIEIDDSTCIMIVSEYLARVGIDTRTFYVDSVIANTNGEGENANVYSKTVTLHRKINGVDVYGNSKILVDVDPSGSVSSIYSMNRQVDLTSMKRISIISLQTAFERIKQGNVTIDANGGFDTIHFEECAIVFWENSNPDSSDPYLQPVYRLVGNSSLNDRDSGRVVVYIPAAE
jgi:hypothetical protein